MVLSVFPSFAQDLKLVTVTRVPFSMEAEGVQTGFSLELWQLIAEQQGWTYEIERVDSFAEMLAAVETGRADVAAANISITAEREQVLDFTQPIFASGLRIMVPASGTGNGLFQLLFSWDLMLAIIGAFALLLGSGMIMWMFERGRQEYFNGPAKEKIFPAFWWALNLVVNGGFEERMPRSGPARVFATFLVISSLFIVSIFVAKITSVMTVNAIQTSVQSVNDLYGKRVGTIGGSTAAQFMASRDLNFIRHDNLDELLNAFEEGALEAVVFDAPILAYYANTRGAGQAELVGSIFRQENYGFALPQDSPLREEINRSLLGLSVDDRYRNLVTNWFGVDASR